MRLYEIIKQKRILQKGVGYGLLALLMYIYFRVYRTNLEFFIVNTRIKKINTLFHTKNEAIEFVYNPWRYTRWIGDPGLGNLFLREFLLKKHHKNAQTFSKPLGFLEFSYMFESLVVYYYRADADAVYIKMNTINDMAKFFGTMLEECKKDFFIIPINFFTNTQRIPIHANILIFNKKKRVIEHYEPYGAVYLPESYSNLEKIFKLLGITYKSPWETTPPIGGPQMFEFWCLDYMPKVNSVGFGIIWSLWLMDLRLNSPDVDSKMLVQDAVKKLKNKDNKNICVFIVAYAQFILEFSKKYELVINKDSGYIFDYTPINKTKSKSRKSTMKLPSFIIPKKSTIKLKKKKI